MWKFLKYTFATFVGTTLGLIFFFVIGIAVVAGVAIATISGEDTIEIAEQSVLIIDLDAPVVERTMHNPFKDFDIMSLRSETKLGLGLIVQSIHKAMVDDNIRGILLKGARELACLVWTKFGAPWKILNRPGNSSFLIPIIKIKKRIIFQVLPIGCICIQKLLWNSKA